MVKFRTEREQTKEPPIYESDSKQITLCLNFGGVAYHTPTAKYVGGEGKNVDYVDAENLSMAQLETMADVLKMGKGQERKFYIIQSNRFKEVMHTGDLRTVALQFLDIGLMNVYLVTVGDSDGCEDEDDEYDSDYDDVGGSNDEDDDLFDEYIDQECIETELCGQESGVQGDEPCQGDGSCQGDQTTQGGFETISSEDSDPNDAIVDSDKEFSDIVESDSEGRRPGFPRFAPTDMSNPTFEIGLIFATRDEFKKAVNTYAIKQRRSIRFTKTDPKRVYAKCDGEECPWKIHAIRVPHETQFQVNLFHPKHTCESDYEVRNMKSTWLSENYAGRFKTDPNRDLKGFRLDVMKEIKVNVSQSQIYRAKRRAVKLLEGDPAEQYGRLWDYAKVIKETNHGSTVVLGVNEDNTFDRFYVCLAALKEGYKVGCRPIIGVDGCFLKGPYGGVLLTALGVDPSNNTFPICYAVVAKENGETWGWFFRLLKTDLEIDEEHPVTFMSDKQKGLIQAFEEVFPGFDHRFCARHLHMNFQQAGYRGLTLKTAFWRAARASTIGEFRVMMDKIQSLDVNAYAWLQDKPPNQWSMSHFSEFPKCDMLLNNFCEGFNSTILPARGKPIISMLEWIREHLMMTLQKNRDKASRKWSRKKFCPKILKLLQRNKELESDCQPIKSSNVHYQISCHDGSQFSVDLEKRMCTCRRWQLNGIPCKHAICAISNQKSSVEDFLHPCYSVERYKKVYAPSIKAIPSKEFWEPTEYIPPLPPPLEKKIGRPTTLRRRGNDEPQKHVRKRQGTFKLKKKQESLSCRYCGEPGHNQGTCPDGPPHRKKSKARPKEQASTIDEADPDLDSVAQDVIPSQVSGVEETIPTQTSTTNSNTIGPRRSMRNRDGVVKGTSQNPMQASTSNMIPGPSIFNQLHPHQTHVLPRPPAPSRIQIRAPPLGMTPMFCTKLATRGDTQAKSIIVQGQKFVNLSDLARSLKPNPNE